MKKQLKFFSLLAVILLGTFTVASRLLLIAVDATYVEGNIEQDTTWTLTDSPFIVINNVIIKPGFMLTIEPGVEIRFGGNFSLIVEGRLTAVGTQENMITFSSNRDQPQAGDWNTVEFVNIIQSSTVAYCIVEYATNGITIEKGNVQIRNSEISNNLQNGIYVTDDNNANLRENILELNQNGVFIDGHSSGTTIENNLISLNTENGIRFQSSNGTYINNIAVLNNTLSTNSKAIYIFGQVSTDITRNSISYNNIGVFYENATGIMPLQFNDIYGNNHGMNVSVSNPVNAEYNYWGDETGPYHASLNPAGKGNPVESNGVNLDFIPFLSASNGYINERPVARLLSDRKTIPPNQPVTFVATTSSDDRRVDKYFFDFGDGQNSSWTTLSIFEHRYVSNGTYQASVMVMDDFRVVSNNAAVIDIAVQILSQLDVSLTLSPSTVVSGGQVAVSVQVSLAAAPMENANVALFSIPSGDFEPLSGLTNSTGYFVTTIAAPNVTEQKNVRMTATASRSGYADGSDHKYVIVVPPLSVYITANPSVIKSEATSNVTLHVTHNTNPVEGVAIVLSSNGGGNFSPETGLTDANGDFKFVFTAPQRLTQLNLTITATATKSGYWDGVAQTGITVTPRTLSVQVTVNPETVDSTSSLDAIVHVTSDGAPVSNATVTLSSNAGGNFSATIGFTDANGDFRFAFTAPEATEQVELTITTSVTKTGYVDGEAQTRITVNSVAGSETTFFGLSLTTLLLIVIPIVVVVIVAVLIKAKVIVISRD